MSEDTDRIAVPTNGTGRHSAVDVPEGKVAAKAVGEAPGDVADTGAVSRDQTVGFTPNQLAAGFGIVAGLLLLFAARRRRGRD